MRHGVILVVVAVTACGDGGVKSGGARPALAPDLAGADVVDSGAMDLGDTADAAQLGGADDLSPPADLAPPPMPRQIRVESLQRIDEQGMPTGEPETYTLDLRDNGTFGFEAQYAMCGWFSVSIGCGVNGNPANCEFRTKQTIGCGNPCGYYYSDVVWEIYNTFVASTVHPGLLAVHGVSPLQRRVVTHAVGNCNGEETSTTLAFLPPRFTNLF